MPKINPDKESEQKIEVLSSEGRTFAPSKELSNSAYINQKEYDRLYKESIDDPEAFWSKMAEENLTWIKKWDHVLDYDFHKPYIKWFEGGSLNVSYNCLDRHLETKGDKTALIFEGDDGSVKKYTYKELHVQVCKLANVFKSYGVKKGDRITLYMPMIPELLMATLASARIGAIHSVVFGGFSPAALRDRINDCESSIIMTADEGVRGGKAVPLKANCDEALKECPTIKTMLVVKRTGATADMTEGRDFYIDDELKTASADCPCEEMGSEDPLFILYTSGSTGKPKGVLHTTAGYLLYAATTFKYIFDADSADDGKGGDIHFCTADIGWVTGHSYIVYGPLCNGSTTVMFEGIPTYPDVGRFWDICEKHKVTIFYTAPTAIRALMRSSTDFITKHDLSTLRILGSVGEPINPEAWMWYFENVGKSKLPIVDTWWQTETGGIMLTPLPGAHTLKPGSASRPFFGVSPKIFKEDGFEAGVNEGGYLVIDKPWPGMLRGTYGDEKNERIKEVYFSRFPGVYFTGDSARIDKDGDFWLMGRVDDVLNVSGHRLGTAEIESSLVSHKDVSEAAVVGYPHDVKGEGIYAFVTLKEGVNPSDEMRKELIAYVKSDISAIAKPDKLQFAPGLPKTRSGKIMRRILRKIAAGHIDEVGDTSTLADPSVVDSLLKERL